MIGRVALALFSYLPARVRERIKQAVGAGGHAGSVLDSWRAERLAAEWKRPDFLFPLVNRILRSVGWQSLDGRSVLEFGAGYLLADAFIYSMLGADSVDAVDYVPLLQGRQFRRYVSEQDWSPYLEIAAQLRGREGAEAWSRRLAAALSDRGADWYRHLGIRYVAPFDVSTSAAPAHQYDLVISRSTLEHVPPELAERIVGRLCDLVAPGGVAFHYIHLADHRDIRNAPLAFLGANDDYHDSQFDLRGNRMRASDWRVLFSRQRRFRWQEVAHGDVGVGPPSPLADKFAGYETDDLAVIHYTIWGTAGDAPSASE